MYSDSELKAEMYGSQNGGVAWETPKEFPASPDRSWANLGQPLRHLSGEPDPLALWVLFSTCHGKNRAKLSQKYFGKAKRGPR